jgi:hypothetical protein
MSTRVMSTGDGTTPAGKYNDAPCLADTSALLWSMSVDWSEPVETSDSPASKRKEASISITRNRFVDSVCVFPLKLLPVREVGETILRGGNFDLHPPVAFSLPVTFSETGEIEGAAERGAIETRLIGFGCGAVQTRGMEHSYQGLLSCGSEWTSTVFVFPAPSATWGCFATDRGSFYFSEDGETKRISEDRVIDASFSVQEKLAVCVLHPAHGGGTRLGLLSSDGVLQELTVPGFVDFNSVFLTTDERYVLANAWANGEEVVGLLDLATMSMQSLQLPRGQRFFSKDGRFMALASFSGDARESPLKAELRYYAVDSPTPPVLLWRKEFENRFMLDAAVSNTGRFVACQPLAENGVTELIVLHDRGEAIQHRPPNSNLRCRGLLFLDNDYLLEGWKPRDALEETADLSLYRVVTTH